MRVEPVIGLYELIDAIKFKSRITALTTSLVYTLSCKLEPFINISIIYRILTEHPAIMIRQPYLLLSLVSIAVMLKGFGINTMSLRISGSHQCIKLLTFLLG